MAGGATLLLDIGSTAIKAMIVDRDSGEVAAHEAMPAPESDVRAGRVEISPDQLLGVLRQVADEIVDGAPVAPDEVMVSTQMHTALLADAGGAAISPFISWQDGRLLEPAVGHANHLERLVSAAGGEWSRAGMAQRPGFGAGNLGVWLRENSDHVRAHGAVHTVGSFVATSLGAAHETHVSNAASLGVLDVERGEWSARLQEVHGLGDWTFPTVRQGAARTEKVRLGGAEMWWRGDLADHQASVLGAGGLGPHDLAVSLGTAGIAARFADEPSAHPEVDSRPYPGGGYLRTVSRQPGGAAAAAFARFAEGIASGVTALQVTEHTVWRRTAHLAALPPSNAWMRFTRRVDGGTELEFGGIDPARAPFDELYSAFVRAYIEAYRRAVDLLFDSDDRPRRVQFNGGFAARNEAFRTALSAGLGLEIVDVPSGDLALEGLRRAVVTSKPTDMRSTR